MDNLQELYESIDDDFRLYLRSKQKNQSQLSTTLHQQQNHSRPDHHTLPPSASTRQLQPHPIVQDHRFRAFEEADKDHDQDHGSNTRHHQQQLQQQSPSPSSPSSSSSSSFCLGRPTLLLLPPHQIYHSFLCLDFESTCIDSNDPGLENPERLTDSQIRWSYPNEIIEWPVLLLQWRLNHQNGAWELFEVDRFHRFVRPTWRVKVSEFCNTLTGITQEQVDQAMRLPEVIDDFDKKFVKKHQLFTNQNRTVWVTDGPWDFRDHFLKSIFLSRIRLSNLPRYLSSPIPVIDTRYLIKIFVPKICRFDISHISFDSLNSLIESFGLSFVGQNHCGLDDTINISRLLNRMVEMSRQDVVTGFEKGERGLRWVFRANRFVELSYQRFFWMGKDHKCTWTKP
ncbi:ribonuclease H-like domain-containing protein [Phakopsora pachyrhizi]|uniref:Ribonuclease H-like domain-containing protein n=1 Tax=Phakopsora pachyrhizi TaxID=170000 RepID=A0AAV0B7B1_PHAPC|nr:ribonuclease H-like domain-containing protein [Phakopsora pachyrhizi]